MSNQDESALPSFRIDWGLQGILRLATSYAFDSVLDIGSGSGDHARLLRHLGKTVTTVDIGKDADIRGDFLAVDIGRTFDLVWCSHVLEHQRNVGLFLDKLSKCLDEGGILAISVPLHPAERTVAGHLTVWSPELLCYNLVLAGFDCRDAIFTRTVDLSLIVTKRTARIAGVPLTDIPEISHFPSAESGEDPFVRLAPLFPFPLRQGGEDRPDECGWGGYSYRFAAGIPPFRLFSRFLPEEGLLVSG